MLVLSNYAESSKTVSEIIYFSSLSSVIITLDTARQGSSQQVPLHIPAQNFDGFLLVDTCEGRAVALSWTSIFN